MILFFKFLGNIFGKKKSGSGGHSGGGATAASASGELKTGMAGKPITCNKCKRAFGVKEFPATNGVCPKCENDDFSFLTDEVPDDELEANKNLSDGAKYVLDADDRHIKSINGRKLITYLRNQGLI